MEKIKTPAFYGFAIALTGALLMLSLVGLDLLGQMPFLPIKK